MPVVFDEISGEVAPERAGTPSPEQHQEADAQPGADPAELVRRELRIARERELRLIAD